MPTHSLFSTFLSPSGFLTLFLLPLAFTATGAPATGVIAVDPVPESLPPFNRLVLDTLREYPTDGTHGYWWPRNDESQYSGATRDLFFRGKRVMSGEPKRRTYCCGLTLEVFLRAYQRWLENEGGEEAAALEVGDWPTFQRLWFVEKANGPGPCAALERYGLGRGIQPEEVLPGDFVQIWRTRNKDGKETGHSVIFLGWVRARPPDTDAKDEAASEAPPPENPAPAPSPRAAAPEKTGDVIGMLYWSTQPGTDGIDERIEYFGPFGGVSTQNTYYARVEPDPRQRTTP